MEVIGGMIKEYPGYANPPTLIVRVDKVPDQSQFVYRRKDFLGKVLYFAEKDGAVRFFCHDPQNESGYSGSTFSLHLEDGTTVDIRGPWSSRAGVMRQHFDDCVDVEILPIAGYRLYGHVSLITAQRAIEFTDRQLILNDDGEPHWEVSRA